MNLRDRMNRIGMALCGPADTGPYGPPVAPPIPRLRDAHHRLIKKAKAKREDITALATATTVATAVAAAVTFATIGDAALFTDTGNPTEVPATEG